MNHVLSTPLILLLHLPRHSYPPRSVTFRILDMWCFPSRVYKMLMFTWTFIFYLLQLWGINSPKRVYGGHAMLHGKYAKYALRKRAGTAGTNRWHQRSQLPSLECTYSLQPAPGMKGHIVTIPTSSCDNCPWRKPHRSCSTTSAAIYAPTQRDSPIRQQGMGGSLHCGWGWRRNRAKETFGNCSFRQKLGSGTVPLHVAAQVNKSSRREQDRVWIRKIITVEGPWRGFIHEVCDPL